MVLVHVCWMGKMRESRMRTASQADSIPADAQRAQADQQRQQTTGMKKWERHLAFSLLLFRLVFRFHLPYTTRFFRAASGAQQPIDLFIRQFALL